LIHALALAENRDRQRLQDMAQDLKPAMVPELRELLGKYGSLDHARKIARHYTLQAQENLEAFPESREKTYFRAITEELLERSH
jgi:geranylgeranyl pyrophosphate synthase